jgi:ribonuclease HIII
VLQRALRAKGPGIQLEQRTKGESDTAVAAASILARERFIDWMDKTSAACGIKLPLGASDAVIQAAANWSPGTAATPSARPPNSISAPRGS